MMFKVKKSKETGTCWAMRCKVPCHEGGDLCQKHDEIWRGEGSPPLASAEPTAGPSTALAVSVPATLEGQLTKERMDAQQVLQIVQTLPVDTAEQRDMCGALINQAKDKIKGLEAERKSVTGPLNQIKKTIDGWFSPVEDFYTSVAKTLEKKLLAWEAEQKAARTEGLKLIQAGAGAAPAQAFMAAHQDVSLPDNVGVRRQLSYEITDWAALPGQYKMMVANHEAIKADVAKVGLALNVAGLRVFEDPSITKGRE